MDILKKLLKSLGLNDDLITQLIEDKAGDDVTADSLSSQIHDELGKIYASKNKLTDEQLKEARIIALKDIKKQIARELGVQKSNSEIEAIEPVSFVKLIGEHVKSEYEALKNGTNDTFKKEIDGLKEKLRSQDDVLENLKLTHKKEIDMANESATKKIQGYEKTSKVDSILSGMNFAFGEEIVGLAKKNIRETVSAMNFTEVNGKLYEPDGTTPFTIEGKRINTLKEFVEESMNPYTKKVNPVAQPGFNPVVQGLQPSEQEVAQKAAEAFMNRNQNQG